MGTVNSKREVWLKNGLKTSKIVLKTKNVDAGITPFFSGVNFEHVLKMAVKTNFLCKIVQKTPSKQKELTLG